MAIKQFKGYDNVKPYGDYEPLPKGGYVLKITNVKLETGDYGDYVRVRCDIAEGEYKDYFMNDYQGQNIEDKKWHCDYMLYIPKDDGSEKDAWTQRRFKTFTTALEESNEGYHFDWDEEKFVGKLIGGLFNEREYRKQDGSIGRATNFKRVCDVKKIRANDYKLPKDDTIEGGGEVSTDFMNVAENGVEVPFS